MDIRFHVAFLGAAASRAPGEREEAKRWLGQVGLHEHAPVDALARCVEQRLLLAAEEGRSDADATARAESMLAEGRVPVLLIERLRRALETSPR